MNARSGAFLGLVGLFALLLAVFIGVFELRFESGEIYPHYSSLRSDPLGSQALYESFEDLPGFEVSRNSRNLMAIDTLDGDTALWLVGISRQSFRGMRAPEDSPVLEAVEKEGAHLVITLNPLLVPEEFDLASNEAQETWWERRESLRRGESEEPSEEEAGETTSSDPPETEEAPDADEEATERTRAQTDHEPDHEIEFETETFESLGDPLVDWLEVAVKIPDRFERPDEGWPLEGGEADASRPLPTDWPLWRSPYHFGDLGSDWKVAATVEGEPVVVFRTIGKGSIVLASDSYFASNEALWKDPCPELLLWLTGGKRRLIFDETIHGTVESGGVMKVIRRYRFHGFFIGLAVFIGLLAWRSASSLAPGNEALERGLRDDAASVTGEEATTGFLRLLRLNVPPKQLLRTCVETWRNSGGAGLRVRQESEGQRAAIDGVVASHEASPKTVTRLDAFREITRILAHPDDFARRDRS